MSSDTIFALATPRGKSGVAVVRISGPAALDGLRGLGVADPDPRRAVLATFRSPDGQVIDRGIVLYFPDGGSFTGEAVVELQVHGSPAVIDLLFAVLGGLPGFRPALAGQFTRRALENDRMDLAQVEGLADLIEAETEAQRRQAQAVLDGAVGALVGGWRDRLVRAAALLEATIDFADEEVPVDVAPEVSALVSAVRQELVQEISGFGAAERVRDGFVVAIVGAPNVGKSTLLNALAGRDAAITSEVAGTTRDVIEVRMDIGGLPVTLLDTAGLREGGDVVERIGISRAIERANQADVRVLLAEAADPIPEGLTLADEDIRLLPKRDDGSENGVSGRTGAGVRSLIERLAGIFGARASGAGVLTRQRHVDALTRANTSLVMAADGLEGGALNSELVAENLRSAARALDSLIGRVDVEHLLDEIFARFCIGK